MKIYAGSNPAGSIGLGCSLNRILTLGKYQSIWFYTVLDTKSDGLALNLLILVKIS